MNRRTFLQSSGLGLSFLGLPNLYGSPNQSHKKSVIFLFLAGGMSHAESFNAAPDSVDRFRSVNGYIQTKMGNYIGGNWTNMSKNDHLFTMIQNFTHSNAGHQSATNWINTGYNFNDENPGATQSNPSYGSIISKTYGVNTDRGIPIYISTGNIFGQAASYLGGMHNPFTIDDNGKKNLTLSIDESRFIDRFNTMRLLDKQFNNTNLKIVDDNKTQAYQILFGHAARAFNIELEPEKHRKKYTDSRIGRHCLLARRLIEYGSRFVTIVHGGWDMHQNIKTGMDNLVPEVDLAISTLLNDLSDRGLLDTTLVVIGTEFGRTPLNKDAGRDHAPGLTPLVLAGGNYKNKSFIGKMDKNGVSINGNSYTPINLLNTVLGHMDIDLYSKYQDFSGRPRFISDSNDKRIII